MFVVSSSEAYGQRIASITIWYDVVAKNDSCQWIDNEEEGIVGFDLFDLFMGEELS